MVASEEVVHAISALGVPYLGLLCNCDMQVCKPYKTRLFFGIESPFYKAHQRVSINEEKCVGCGTCQDVCPFNVPEIDEELNISKIASDACFGCGICIRNCPEDVITYIEYDSSF
ncbi:MAG: 4Fe-4S binding protein [Candidatus Hodarchaeota archaeon]